MIEYSIFKLFLSDVALFVKYRKSINIDFVKENYKDLYKVFCTIDSYYTKYKDCDSISIVDLEAHYHSIYPILKEGDKKQLQLLLQKIDEAETNDSIFAYLDVHHTRSVAGELALIAFSVSEGKSSLDELHNVYSRLDVPAVDVENSYVTDDLEELYAQQIHEKGLRWRLQWLNRSLGSLRKGDFGFIFARPESGKTTFLASESTFFAEQLGEGDTILWCNNEEGGQKVKIRCYQASLGVTTTELFHDIGKSKEKYNTLVGTKIKIYDDAGMTMHSIEQRCKELNPKLIILDQIDKIKGYKDDRYDLQMKAIYQWARELAKKYGPVIAVCQAGGTGEGKRYLTMNDVDSSHTAKQGEADFIVGIGKSNDEGLQNVRFLNISKNKLTGDEDTEAELRHGRTECLIKAEIARYDDI